MCRITDDASAEIILLKLKETGRGGFCVMPDDKDQDLRDIQAEETTRGKKHPKKALSLERRRMIAELARMLQDSRCDQANLCGSYSRVRAARGVGRVSSTPCFVEEAPRKRLTTTRCAERMRRSCSSAGRVSKCPATTLVNSRLNSREEIFFFVDFFLDFLANVCSKRSRIDP